MQNSPGTASQGLLSPLIVLVGTVLALAVTSTAPAKVVENRLADFRRSLHGAEAPYSEKVVVVAIDDMTLASLPYVSPVDRNLLATVVAELDKRNPASIGLDILLDRPSDPAADQALIRAIEAAESPVVAVIDPGAARDEACPGASGSGNAGSVGRLMEGVDRVAGVGHGVQCPDGVDDVMRRATYRDAGGYPALAAAMARAADPQSGPIERQGLSLPIALTRDGGWPFVTLSAAHLDYVPDAWIAGKHVLIGQITPYSGDWRLTPMRFAPLRAPVEPAGEMPRGRMPGVVLHGFALEALLTGARGPHTSWLAMALAAVCGALAGLGIGALRAPWWTKLLAVVVLIGIGWWAVFAAYAWAGALLPFVPSALGLVLTAGASLALQERGERLMRQSIHNAFEHFLAPQVVEQLVREPELLTLKAEEREVSAMFTDLAGFTHLIDHLPPDVAADVLNGYLDIIVQDVMDHGGAVDKIVGDAVHALFSAPIADPDHRLRAARCALSIEARTEAYRERLREQGIALGETRIGLNAGRAIVGNFGANRRLDYTAHGSTINLAARLESANKVLGTRICVHETSCVDATGCTFWPIGRARVRGLVEPVRLFALRGPAQDPAGALADYCAAMEAPDLDAAARRLDTLARAAPDDGLVAFQLARVKAGTFGDVIEL